MTKTTPHNNQSTTKTTRHDDNTSDNATTVYSCSVHFNIFILQDK